MHLSLAATSITRAHWQTAGNGDAPVFSVCPCRVAWCSVLTTRSKVILRGILGIPGPSKPKATVSAARALQSNSAQNVNPRVTGHSFAVGIVHAATGLVLAGADFRCSTIECVQMGAVFANAYEWFVAGFGDFDNRNIIPWYVPPKCLSNACGLRP